MTSFNIVAACVTELSWCDYCAEVEIRRIEGEEMRAVPVPWLLTDDDLLRALAMRGLSEGEIAEQMQRNKSSVRSRAAKIEVAIARDRNGMQKRQKAGAAK